MDFEIPSDIQQTLSQLDQFIDDVIKPIEQRDDNIRFFDHRREYARTDFENGGVPRQDWEALLAEMRRAADAAGLMRSARRLRAGICRICMSSSWPMGAGLGLSTLSPSTIAVIEEQAAVQAAAAVAPGDEFPDQYGRRSAADLVHRAIGSTTAHNSSRTSAVPGQRRSSRRTACRNTVRPWAPRSRRSPP